MRDAIFELAPLMDAIVMAAAVSDYRPAERALHKLKKKQAGPHTVMLEPNEDILEALGKVKTPNQALVGFAAETESLLENAKDKLVRKNLDFIVANDLTQKGCGFACDTNEVKIIERNGAVADMPPMTKEQVASEIWDRVERLLAGGKN
jgi:phosphopantothenoylcysteine decarboxylase/phosphopantothenate--cysteine ligase